MEPDASLYFHWENFQLAVAQLVEWLAHMQEVPGSNPGPDLSLTTCEPG